MEKDLELIRCRGEEVVLIGDFNKQIGSDYLGIPGNKPIISYGGQMVRDLLATENYLLVNNSDKVTGGPWTREDPSDRNKKSCLDFAIVSIRLVAYIKELIIDKEKKYAMNRVTYKKGKLTLTPADHYTMFLVLHNLPLGRQSKEQVVKWNLKKPGGWKTYEEATNVKAKDIRKIIEDENKPVEKVVQEFEKIHNKIKFQAFGKTRINPGKRKGPVARNEELGAEELIKRQAKLLEEEIQNIKDMKHGRGTKVFKLREVIQGPKKPGQEACSVKDPISKEMVFAPKEIQKVSLRYCRDVLTNNAPDPDYLREIEIKEIIHEVRMKESKESNNRLPNENDFKKVVDKMRKK